MIRERGQFFKKINSFYCVRNVAFKALGSVLRSPVPVFFISRLFSMYLYVFFRGTFCVVRQFRLVNRHRIKLFHREKFRDNARNPFDVWISIKLFECRFYNGQNFPEHLQVCTTLHPFWSKPTRKNGPKTSENFESERLLCLRAIFDYTDPKRIRKMTAKIE